MYSSLTLGAVRLTWAKVKASLMFERTNVLTSSGLEPRPLLTAPAHGYLAEAPLGRKVQAPAPTNMGLRGDNP